jgi:hypothetical protein
MIRGPQVSCKVIRIVTPCLITRGSDETTHRVCSRTYRKSRAGSKLLTTVLLARRLRRKKKLLLKIYFRLVVYKDNID